jgi:hypothetical protein
MIDVDFQNDLRRAFIGVLSLNANDEDLSHILNMTEFQLVACYLNWRSRIIDQQPRQLMESMEFAAAKLNPSYFTLVPTLLTKIQNGDNLLPHLSRRILSVYTHRAKPKPLEGRPDLDFLLNDWGIHHLHLSDEMEPGNTGFVKRGDPLLFAIFMEDRAYLIDILGHNDFANDHLIRVLVSNWPNDNLVVKRGGVLPGSEPTTEERRLVRSAGVDMAVKVDGYAFISGLTLGLTAAGTSSRTTHEARLFVRRIIEVEATCKQPDFVKRLYSNVGLTCPSHPELRLVSLGDGWGIVDGQSGNLLHRI